MIKGETLQTWFKQNVLRDSEPFSSNSRCQYCGHMVTAKGSSTKMAELYARLKLNTHIKEHCLDAPQSVKDEIRVTLSSVLS